MGKMRGLAATMATAVLAVGCTHLVHWEEEHDPYDDSALQTRVATVEGDVSSLQNDVAALRSAMTALEQTVGAHVDDDDMHGSMRVSLPVHFDFDRADVREVDRPILDAFAAGIRGSYPNAIVTVEGFADRAGSSAHNRRLTQQRADNVKDYLVSSGGLSADNVRSIGLGQARQVNPDARGPGQSGIENRRVTFVVEYSGSAN